MRNYEKVQLVAYGTPTSTPIRVLPAGDPGETDYDADIRMRGATLCKVADWIRTNHGATLADSTVLKVLVVPEFYFRFGGPVPPGANDVLNNSYPNAQGKIQNLMGDILTPHFSANTWNDWLIVAGSVFWHVPGKDTTNGRIAYLNTSIVINGGDVPEEEPDTNDDPATVPTLHRASTNQKALMSHIDWSIKRGEDKRAWDAALNPMFEVLLNDEEYLRWHRFKLGGKANGVGRQLVFGVEVCLEHVEAKPGSPIGVLRVLENKFPTLPASDVHVVTSCGMDLDPRFGITTRRFGVSMLCDGYRVEANDPWPTSEVRVTTRVTNSGARQTTSETRLGKYELPENLQVGAPYDPRTPKDAIAIWDPVDLP